MDIVDKVKEAVKEAKEHAGLAMLRAAQTYAGLKQAQIRRSRSPIQIGPGKRSWFNQRKHNKYKHVPYSRPAHKLFATNLPKGTFRQYDKTTGRIEVFSP